MGPTAAWKYRNDARESWEYYNTGEATHTQYIARGIVRYQWKNIPYCNRDKIQPKRNTHIQRGIIKMQQQQQYIKKRHYTK